MYLSFSIASTYFFSVSYSFASTLAIVADSVLPLASLRTLLAMIKKIYEEINVAAYVSLPSEKRDLYVKLQRIWASKKATEEGTTIVKSSKSLSERFLKLYFDESLMGREEIYSYLKDDAEAMKIKEVLDPHLQIS